MAAFTTEQYEGIHDDSLHTENSPQIQCFNDLVQRLSGML